MTVCVLASRDNYRGVSDSPVHTLGGLRRRSPQGCAQTASRRRTTLENGAQRHAGGSRRTCRDGSRCAVCARCGAAHRGEPARVPWRSARVAASLQPTLALAGCAHASDSALRRPRRRPGVATCRRAPRGRRSGITRAARRE